jgi:hypothetical protein
MELSTLGLVGKPNGLPEEFVWLTFREGDQTYLVRIARADVDGFAQQTLPRHEQDALVEKNRDTLAAVIEEKRERGWSIQQPMPNGVPIQAIPLTRADLESGMRRYPVSSSTGSSPMEWGSEVRAGALAGVHPPLDPVGQPSTPLPLRANPQQPPEPQQPIMSPGVIGTQPGPGGGATGTSLPVQSYLVTTPLVYPTPLNYAGAPSLVSLTLRFGDGLHNLLPGHMAALLEEECEGWVRVPTTSRDQVLDLLARVGTQPDQALREAIIVALDHRTAALQFSEPRSFGVRDLLTLATAVTAYSALGSDALVVVALAGTCFVLLQVFLGLATVINYGVTRIGTVLVDRVAEKLLGGAPPPR